MSVETATMSLREGNRAVGLRDMFLVLVSPRSVFARIEDTGAYGPALAVLILLVIGLGYAEVQTGLIDRTVAQQTERRRAELEESQGHLLDRIELRDRLEAIGKEGEFARLLARLGVIVLTPVWILASFLFIAAILYALVALSGRKPEYHTLMSICTYAGVILLVAAALRLAMVMTYETTSVDTSLGMFVPAGQKSVLFALDPFRLWFWGLVALGVIVTRQLNRKTAILSCLMMALVATGIRMALSMAGGGG